MISPSVSVILTAHNYGRFLDQSIRSVLDQTFRDFELIIVNDGSTDDTAEVAARYAGDPRVRILTLPGVGLAAACNRGIREARGELILRLDADDFLDPRSLMVEVGLLRDHPEVGLVYPDHYTVDERGALTGTVRLPRVQDGACLLDWNPPPGGAVVRRSCYGAIGGYEETLRYQEDFDFWLRFTECFQAYGAGVPLLFYRRHAGSMSRNRAPRAAARRHVKRCFAETRRLLAGEIIGLVIPTVWPGAPPRREDLLSRDLGGETVIGLAVSQARGCSGIGRTLVVCDHEGLREVVSGGDVEPFSARSWDGESGAPGERPELAWLRGLLKVLRESDGPTPSILLMASPYCPLRHPGRIQEALDTLAIHRCDLVVSVDVEPVRAWGVGATSLEPVAAPGRMYREAGELLAVRTRWLDAGRSLTDVRVGYVELIHPEWWCFYDEAALEPWKTLLPQAAALRVPPSAYLRTDS